LALNENTKFTASPNLGWSQVSAANASTDGSGTVVTSFTAGNNSSTVENIRVKATGTTTAGMIRLYIDDLSAIRLWKEIPVTAITRSASVASYEAYWQPENTLFVLPSGAKIKASTEKAEAFNILVQGADF
jgi:hypothetical protein